VLIEILPRHGFLAVISVYDNGNPMNSSTSKRKAKASKKRAAGRARGTSNQQETSTLEGGNKLPSIPNDPSVLSALDEEYQKLRSLGHAIPQPKVRLRGMGGGRLGAKAAIVAGCTCGGRNGV